MKSKRVTKSQLSITQGDMLLVTKDDGSQHTGVAESEPWKLGGHTWVVLVSGISGAYDLTRCRKANPIPA